MVAAQPHGGPFSIMRTGDDWERVPWFDLVNHTASACTVRVIQRYQGNRSR